MELENGSLEKKEYIADETILSVINVSKEFDGKVILRDVNFEVKNIKRPDITQGQIWSILGKSGAGKTTMAKIIAGLLQPTTGEILINDEKRPIKKGEVGFVFQDYISFDHLTVLNNLLLAAYQGIFREHAEKGGIKNLARRFNAWFFNKKILKEKVDQYLEIFKLKEHLDKYPCQLSGGQKQRLAILMQALCSSQFIVLDEPFSGQDPEMKQKACETIIKVGQINELETLLIITHDIECAVWVSDTLLPLGVEKDPETKIDKPGSTVFKPFDLAERGLAWQDASVCRTKEFVELVQEIKYHWFPNM